MRRCFTLHKAICKWQDIANQELQAFGEDVKQRWSPVWDEHGYDPVENEAATLLETERTMFASLSVSIASVVENFVFAVCQHFSINCEKENQSPDFAGACRCLGCKKQIMLGQSLDITATTGHGCSQTASSTVMENKARSS